jgi:hypothetical protein
VTLLCSFHESWDHLVTSISFSTTNTLEFDYVVGDLLSKEVRKKSSIETSTLEALVVRGESERYIQIQVKGKDEMLVLW